MTTIKKILLGVVLGIVLTIPAYIRYTIYMHGAPKGPLEAVGGNITADGHKLLMCDSLFLGKRRCVAYGYYSVTRGIRTDNPNTDVETWVCAYEDRSTKDCVHTGSIPDIRPGRRGAWPSGG